MSPRPTLPFGVSLYGRILSFLKPHAPAVLLAVVAAAIYAVLDAAVYVLLIPFVEALFVSGGAERSVSSNWMQQLLDATVYTWVDLDGDPLVAIGRIIVLIILVFLFKNLFAPGLPAGARRAGGEPGPPQRGLRPHGGTWPSSVGCGRDRS